MVTELVPELHRSMDQEEGPDEEPQGDIQEGETTLEGIQEDTQEAELTRSTPKECRRNACQLETKPAKCI